MNDAQCNNYKKLAKAAVILKGKNLSGTTVLFLAKSQHPLVKASMKNGALNISDKINLDFLLTFPAGHIDLDCENPAQGALRELCEETGGLFYSENISSPWKDVDNSLFLASYKISDQELLKINKVPIIIKMDNSFTKQKIAVSYYFFELNLNKNILEKLNFFCQQAQKKLLGEQYKTYREVSGYFEVAQSIFSSKLKDMSLFTANQDWFFSNQTANNEPPNALLFDEGTKKYQFNKGYFYALSRIIIDLK